MAAGAADGQVSHMPAAKPRRPAAARAWQRMLSGRRLDLLDPSPVDIEIEDIAHGLARVGRWNGQTLGDHPFSVAQHSIVVETLVGRMRTGIEARWRLAALLHDAPEYVIGDMISPFKAALGLDYRNFEARLEAAIHIRFGLPVAAPEDVAALIKQADRASAYLEAVQLAGFAAPEARRIFGEPATRLSLRLQPLPAADAEKAYLARFEALMRQAAPTASKE